MKITVKAPKAGADVDLAEAVSEFRVAKAAVDAAKDTFDKAQHRVLTILKNRGERSTIADINGRKYGVTMVTSERTKIDEKALKEAIGEETFNKLCDKKVSLTKVQEAINKGELGLDVFAAHAQMVETAPYVKVTETNDTAQ